MTQLMRESWRNTLGRLREDIQRAIDRWQQRLTRHDGGSTNLPVAMDHGANEEWLPSSLFDGGPPTVVEDRGDEVVVQAEMPGLTPKDFSIEVADNRLIVRGEKRHERETRGRDYYYSERSFGSFRRTILLPCEINAERASARYQDGMLRVALPKVPGARPRQVKVAEK